MIKFKKGDILGAIKQINRLVPAGTKCRMLGLDDTYPEQMITVEWLDKSIMVKGNGWYATRFKLVAHAEKKIALDDKCFGKTIVPRRVRPMP